MAEGGLDRDAVLAAALSLLDRGGMPALAMRRIAGELGVQQGALYWYFPNKQSLLAALANLIIDTVPQPSTTLWRADVVGYATALRQELLRHRDAGELVSSAFALRLGGQGPLDAITKILSNAGLTPETAAVAAVVVFHFLLGHVTRQQQHALAIRLHAIDRETEDTDTSHQAESQQQFTDGLELIADAIAVRLTKPSH